MSLAEALAEAPNVSLPSCAAGHCGPRVTQLYPAKSFAFLFSNSLIEAWWRILKHQWLYLHTLDNLATVRKPVAFYVTQHNQTIPHSAFQGRTPDEMYFGRGAAVPDELAARRLAARQQREATNRSAACSACPRAAPAADNHVAA